MLKEAIEKIRELALAGIAPDVKEFYGVPYEAGEQSYGAITPPTASPVAVHTLQAVNDYLKMNKDSLSLSGLVVHVVSPRAVTVLGPLRADRTRECFLAAQPINADLVDGFLNKWLPQEAFVLGLQQHFVDTPSRVDLLKLVGNLQTEKARTLVDDGVTQEVAIKSGKVNTVNAIVKQPILVPRRSFPEITLEGVEYVLRMSGGGDGEMPKVALFECDGGAWRVDAIEKIAEHVAEHAGDAPMPWGILS